MAGEKVNKNTRVVKKPEDSSTEPTITLTAEQFKEFMKEAVSTAVEQSKSIPQSNKAEVQDNITSALTKRINQRNIEGQRFDEELANPQGPRKRIVIDKIYKEFTGSAVTVTINGNTVKVPVDGRPHYVHPAHYAAIQEKLRHLSSTRERAAEENEIFGDELGDYQKVGQR